MAFFLAAFIDSTPPNLYLEEVLLWSVNHGGSDRDAGWADELQEVARDGLGPH